MITIPLDEAKRQLTTVQVAISDLISGKSVTQLRIGSGNFQREYKYWKPDTLLNTLLDLRNDLNLIIASYSTETPTFRKHSSVPLISRKDIF